MNFFQYELGTEGLLILSGAMFAGASGSMSGLSVTIKFSEISGSVDELTAFAVIIPVTLLVFFASAITHILQNDSDNDRTPKQKEEKEKAREKQT